MQSYSKKSAPPPPPEEEAANKMDEGTSNDEGMSIAINPEDICTGGQESPETEVEHHFLFHKYFFNFIRHLLVIFLDIKQVFFLDI